MQLNNSNTGRGLYLNTRFIRNHESEKKKKLRTRTPKRSKTRKVYHNIRTKSTDCVNGFYYSVVVVVKSAHVLLRGYTHTHILIHIYGCESRLYFLNCNSSSSDGLSTDHLLNDDETYTKKLAIIIIIVPHDIRTHRQSMRILLLPRLVHLLFFVHSLYTTLLYYHYCCYTYMFIPTHLFSVGIRT